ncbi:hypothetical protein Bbelb_116660 [Branchiostoma belcheri]|nr:hypothetical protein Bbelb_116660 [Branchiostoma belcheri]
MAELEALVVAEHSFRRLWGFLQLRSTELQLTHPGARDPMTSPQPPVGIESGTQLQTFKSVGRNTHAQSSHIRLDHGAFIHVTVVAENAADLKTVVYSDPVLVDLTPPVISDVKDGSQLEDLDYQNTSVISLYWDVRDEESGVDFCDWTIEMTTLDHGFGQTDVQGQRSLSFIDTRCDTTCDCRQGPGNSSLLYACRLYMFYTPCLT